jgi:hypothetical protein
VEVPGVASLEKKLKKECLGNPAPVYDTIEEAKVDAAADREFPGIDKKKKKKSNTQRWLRDGQRADRRWVMDSSDVSSGRY